MDIQVRWSYLTTDDDPRWSEEYCLYTYLHPRRDWLLYIGKADYSTVRRRFHGDHKDQLFRDIRHRYHVSEVRVLHGELVLEPGRRRSSELLSDVESLLIMRLQPFGNIASTQSRITRPGLRVSCRGAWPFKRARFHDE